VLVTLRKSCSRVLGVLYLSRTYRIYRIDLRKSTEPQILQDGLEYRVIGLHDEAVINQIESMEEWLRGSIRARLTRGATCLVALDGPLVAGFNLVSYGRVYIPLIEREWVFHPRDSWSEQITVGRSYRGQGIATTLRYLIFAELRRRGIERLYGGALALNTPSLRLTRKAGFVEILDIHFRKVLSRRTYRYTRLRPR
jgi:RimJ/RimL family protein N-acetyltransferase